MPEFEITVSGIGCFYTENLKAAEFLAKVVKEYRERFEPRASYYGSEKVYDLCIRKQQVAMVEIYNG